MLLSLSSCLLQALLSLVLHAKPLAVTVPLVLYWGRDEEGSMDGISPAEGGADEWVLGIVKVKFVVIGLGKSTVVIRDGEWLTGGVDPSLSQVGVQLQLLLLLLLVLCLVSSLLLLLFLFLLLLLADTGVFELEVPKCLLNIIGAGVFQLNTDTSICVTLETVWGGVSALGSGTLGCVGPQLRDGCKEV